MRRAIFSLLAPIVGVYRIYLILEIKKRQGRKTHLAPRIGQYRRLKFSPMPPVAKVFSALFAKQ